MKRILDSEKLNIIGPQIREARKRAGLSQKQLSDRLELLAVVVLLAGAAYLLGFDFPH